VLTGKAVGRQKRVWVSTFQLSNFLVAFLRSRSLIRTAFSALIVVYPLPCPSTLAERRNMICWAIPQTQDVFGLRIVGQFERQLMPELGTQRDPRMAQLAQVSKHTKIVMFERA
jgi:hypothetical protein